MATTSSASKMNQIYIGLGALAVIGGLYYVQAKKDRGTTNTTYVQGSKESGAPQIKVVPEEIDRVTLKAKDKQEIVLEKKGDTWTMIQPVEGAKVSKSAVDDILNGLKGLTFKEPIAKGAANFASYELEDGKGIHVVASKGGAAVVDLWLGASKSRGQMARLGNDDAGQIWAVSGVSSWTFDKAPKDVREKKIWELSRDNVTTIEVKSAKGSFEFTKDEAAADAGSPAWKGQSGGKPIAGLDAAKVDDLLSAFTLGGVLNADDFADGKSPAETGIEAPDATTVTFKAKDGAMHRIVLGKAEGGKRYARKDGDATVYLLGESPAGWAEADASKFTTAPAGDAGTDAAK
jgi:hypothetical protein